VLTDREIQTFRDDGFVRVERAFSEESARRCRDRLWQELDEDPNDRRTWLRSVARLFAPNDTAFADAASSPRWRQAIAEVAGPDAALTDSVGGTFAIRFPVGGDPGDDGWHVDGSFTGPDGAYWVNHRSRGRALLMLALFSDVGPNDAPTRLRVGSHRLVPAALRPFGEAGTLSLRLELPSEVHDRPVAFATGRAGDVYLCHPFLVHAAQRNLGRGPRFVAQPGVPWRAGIDGFPPEETRQRARVGHPGACRRT
jgi:hypothetical protein